VSVVVRSAGLAPSLSWAEKLHRCLDGVVAISDRYSLSDCDQVAAVAGKTSRYLFAALGSKKTTPSSAAAFGSSGASLFLRPLHEVQHLVRSRKVSYRPSDADQLLTAGWGQRVTANAEVNLHCLRKICMVEFNQLLLLRGYVARAGSSLM